jgi:7-cyano-7-deazaguanine reductase
MAKKKSSGRVAELKSFALGSNSTDYPRTYAPEALEVFANKNPSSVAWTSLVCTEFTSLCPKTGQPDFAKIFINYIAADKMVESKSLNFYLFSFRNHGDFHEDCIQTICDDLFEIMKPKYIEVIGEFTPRGGIAIFPFCSRAASDKFSQALHEERMLGYSPGAYTMELSRLY